MNLPGHEGDVSVIRDYAERVECIYNNETQSGGMGGNVSSVGLEGFLYVIKNKDTGEIEVHWQCYLSDYQQQDARTSYANTDKFIQMMKNKGYLFPGSTLWIQSDGCAKQYKSVTNMWFCWELAKKYKINIDWFITCAGHGKGTVDSLGGTDKHWIFGGLMHSIDCAKFNAENQKLSEAGKLVVWCMHPDRPLGDSKHKEWKVKSRNSKLTD